MRSIWNGHIAFGLVPVPVGLATARQRDTLTFRTLHEACGTPVKQQIRCEACGVDIERSETVAGFEFSKGMFAIVAPDERETLDTRRIEIARLYPSGAIPALMVDRPWWLTPAADPIGRRPYRLLADTMEREQLEALAAVHMFGTDQVCRIRPLDGALLLETLFASSEIRLPFEIAARVADTELSTHEAGLASRLARRLAKGRFTLDHVADTRNRGLERLVEAKMTGAAIATPGPADTAPVQLVDALRASLEQIRSRDRAPVRA